MKNKFTVNCTSAAYFTFHFMAFFQKSGIFGGFYCFFLVFFLVGSNCINPENNYGCLTDFLSQISKLSYFNLLDLADFMMHRTSFRFRFLC